MTTVLRFTCIEAYLHNDNEYSKPSETFGQTDSRMVKSPKGITQFGPEDTNVQLAVQNLKLAVDFSLKENSRALYDLALMHKATKNYQEALKYLKDIGEVDTSGMLEQITALEQMGLIYKEMSDDKAGEEKKKLAKKSVSMLYRALSRAAELYSTTAAVKHIFGKIFQSPSALLREQYSI